MKPMTTDDGWTIRFETHSDLTIVAIVDRADPPVIAAGGTQRIALDRVLEEMRRRGLRRSRRR